MISSSVTSILLMRGSVVAAMLIPALYYSNPVLADQLGNQTKFDRVESVIIRQRHGVQPEFADAALSLRVHVTRLRAVQAVKVQLVRTKRPLDSERGVSWAFREIGDVSQPPIGRALEITL